MNPSNQELHQRRRDLEEKLAWHQRVAVVVALTALGSLGGCMIQQDGATAELSVERLNIIEPDGRLALVLANTEQLPGPILDGEEVDLGRTGAGILFYNGTGDEAGGIAVQSQARDDGGYSADGLFAFDQYRNDQVVSLLYQDNGAERTSGLRVVDRPTSPTLREWLALRAEIESATGERRQTLEERWRDLNRTTNERVFVGSVNGTALVRLRDTLGRDRIRLSVDSGDQAQIEFLDADGTIVHQWPEP